MTIEIIEKDGSYIGKLMGIIDSEKAKLFSEEMAPLMDNADKDIELDCSQLDYICSLVLRNLMQLKKESVAKGGTLVLTHLKGEVLSIFTLTGFYKLFDIR